MATTKLSAVNRMLALIGEAPVAALGSDLFEAQRAEETLDRVTLEVQSRNWYFNDEQNVTFVPSETGTIWLNPLYWTVNTSDGTITCNDIPDDEAEVTQWLIRIDAAKPSLKVQPRGEKLYNLNTKSFVFTDDLVCDVTWQFSFETLPEPVRQYVEIRAARQFAKSFLGSQTIEGLTDTDELQAELTLREFDADLADYNITDDPATARIVFRY